MREAGIGRPRFARMVPRHLLLRGLAAAAVCAILFALPLAMALPLFGDGVFTPSSAIGTKVAITIAFSLIIVPLVAIAATVDADRSNRDLRKLTVSPRAGYGELSACHPRSTLPSTSGDGAPFLSFAERADAYRGRHN